VFDLLINQVLAVSVILKFENKIISCKPPAITSCFPQRYRRICLNVITDDLVFIFIHASRHFRNKKRKYLKDNINEVASNSKNKNIRDLYREIN
jgi:hypothetical protein